MTRKFDENAIAEVIVSVLPAGVAREFSSERDTIRYAVRGEGIKLKKIVLNRASLRKLVNDPSGPVKIEYLQRELLAAATERREFQYPRPLVHVAAKRAFGFAMPLAVGR
jgi:type IV pilus biogenesis protein CpaD/CtpE